MKTITITPAITSHQSMSMHWFMTVIGVIIAITCSFVLLRDIKPDLKEKEQSIVVKTSALREQLTNSARLVNASILTVIK